MSSETDPEREEESSGWTLHEEKPVWPIVVISLLVVALGGGGLIYWKRAALRQHGNEWSSDRHFSKAVEARSEGMTGVALRRALSANALEPGKIRTLRLIEETARAEGDQRLLGYAQALFLHPEASIEDREQALSSFVQAGDVTGFGKLLSLLPEEEQASTGVRAARARIELLRNRPESVLNQISQGDARSDSRLGLIRLDALLQLRREPLDLEAFDLANSLMEADQSDEFLHAGVIKRLNAVAMERFNPESATLLRVSLEAQEPSEGTSERELLVATLGIVVQPEQREVIVTELAKEHGAEGLDDLCLWLLRLRDYDTILDLVDEGRTRHSPIVFQAKVRALIGKQQFEEANALLRFPPSDADQVEAHALAAMIARQLDRGSEETSAWQRAMSAAEKDFTQNHFLKLARLARSAGAKEVAIDAMVAACQNPRGIMPPSSEVNWVLAQLFEQDRPENLLTLTRRLLRSEWDNPVLLNNAVYLSLVTGGAVDKASMELMEDLVNQQPGVGALRNTWILTLVAMDHLDQAEELLISNGENWEAFSDSRKAVMALVKAEKGDFENAEAVMEGIQWDAMMAKESEFFRSRIRALKVEAERLEAEAIES